MTPISRLGVLAVALSTVAAFSNTSPFFLILNGHEGLGRTDGQFERAKTLTDNLQTVLGNCIADNYVIVKQGCVSSADYANRQASPNLRRWLEQAEHKRWIVPEVVGRVNTEAFEEKLMGTCGAQQMDVDVESGSIALDGTKPRVIDLEFNNLCEASPVDRADLLVRNDMFLDAVVSRLPKGESYAIIYTTTPNTKEYRKEPLHVQEVYEMDDPYPSSVHMDLKRDVESHTQSAQLNSTLPLFEKYQFLSPGIFMGLTVSFALLLILYVGINAIASLEVSYFAFSKEMGPAAQRKQPGQ